jgi:hypothetical protein
VVHDQISNVHVGERLQDDSGMDWDPRLDDKRLCSSHSDSISRKDQFLQNGLFSEVVSRIYLQLHVIPALFAP